MGMTQTKTTGQQLAATLRRLNKVGTRTRRFRNNVNVVEAMLDDIRTATIHQGAFSTETQATLAAAWGVYNAWQKHIDGNRIDATLWGRIQRMSPYRLANLLGQMVDAGVTNCGEGERFFQTLKLS